MLSQPSGSVRVRKAVSIGCTYRHRRQRDAKRLALLARAARLVRVRRGRLSAVRSSGGS